MHLSTPPLPACLDAAHHSLALQVRWHRHHLPVGRCNSSAGQIKQLKCAVQQPARRGCLQGRPLAHAAGAVEQVLEKAEMQRNGQAAGDKRRGAAAWSDGRLLLGAALLSVVG